MNIEIKKIVPVLPSQDISRDVDYYEKFVGFKTWFADQMYAVLYRGEIVIHLQWHADNEEDPLLGGSVIRFIVDEIESVFTEFVNRGTITNDNLRLNTPWGTNEFGFFDPNRNLLFFVQEI